MDQYLTENIQVFFTLETGIRHDDPTCVCFLWFISECRVSFFSILET